MNADTKVHLTNVQAFFFHKLASLDGEHIILLYPFGKKKKINSWYLCQISLQIVLLPIQILFCSCINETTFAPCSFMWSLSLLLEGSARKPLSEDIFIKKQTQWSNDKTIIELGYRKISWFVSVSQINYLPQPLASANNWSARHWQITIFCSTSSNNC